MNRIGVPLRCVLLLALGVLVVPPLTAADPPAEGGWKSKALAKDPASTLLGAATSPDGKYRVEFADFGDKVVPPGYPILGVRLRDQSGKSLATWRRLRPTAAVFSADGNYLAVGTESGAIHFISVKDRKVLREFTTVGPKNPVPGIMIGIGALAFAPATTSQTLVAAHDDGSLTAWDPAAGKKLATLAHGSKSGVMLFPGPKESLLAVIGPELRKTDFTLKKWEAEHKLPARVLGVATSADQSVLALACIDLSVTILDAETLKPLQTVKEKGNPPPAQAVNVPGYYFPFAVGLSPKGDQLFTATPDQNGGTVTVWDVKSGKKSGSFTHPPPRRTLGNPTLHLSVLPDGKVKTFWSNIDVTPPLLWSKQEK